MNFRRTYNRLSKTYDFRHSGPTTLAIRRRENRLVRRFASGRTLDVGCGTGFHLPLLEDSVGMDTSEGMLRLVKSSRPLLQARAENLPFREGSFDSVLCMFSTLNMCDHERVIGEMGRVIRPGGSVILSVASIWDRDYDSLGEKKGTRQTREMKRKRFRISGEEMELHLFTRDELAGLFGGAGFSLEHFDSMFILQKPRWGDLNRFSLRERLRLGIERFHRREYGCIYLMVFRKS